MSVTVGRIAEDSVFDYRFVALGHNTIRGAAGAAILNAELLAAKEYFDVSSLSEAPTVELESGVSVSRPATP